MFHKVKAVNVIPDYRLSVQFAEGVTKIYDLKPLFDKWPIFTELKNDEELLYAVEVDTGGYGIVWNDDIDLSCDELFENGKTVMNSQDMYMKNIKRISEMETILDNAAKKMDDFEKLIAEYEEYQSEIRKLEAYYTGDEWKDDFALDEEGKLPADLKRGVLSEDGIYDLLERNKGLLERIKISE